MRIDYLIATLYTAFRSRILVTDTASCRFSGPPSTSCLGATPIKKHYSNLITGEELAAEKIIKFQPSSCSHQLCCICLMM